MAVIISLLVLLGSITIGYAAFESKINVKGKAKVTSNWDIRITDIKEINKTGNGESTISPTWTNLTANMEADLYAKGDSVEYEVTIENKGTLDAKLEDIISNVKSNNEAVKISFSGYTKGETLFKTENKKITVKIEYNKEYEGKAEGSGEVEVVFDYTQAEGGTIVPTDKYLLTYDTNGGKQTNAENEYLEEGADVNLNYIATKDRYKFLGWNTNKEALEGLESFKMPKANTTLYAIYKIADETAPIIDSVSTSATTNSITVVVSAHDDESEITKYEFSINDGEYIDGGNNNVYTFENLKADSFYIVKVKVTNNNELSAEEQTNTKVRAAEQIKAKSGLYADPYEDGRYIYKGENPNNYIRFNNETWRIIAVENGGNLKIVRNSNTQTRAFDSSNSNNWTRPADLNTYLNGEYYNSLTDKDLIQVHNFNIGPHDFSKPYGPNLQFEKNKTWNGKVGLISIGDFFKASTNSECTKDVNDIGSGSASSTNFKCHVGNYLHKLITGNGTNNSWTLDYNKDSTYWETIIGANGCIGNGSSNISTVLYAPALYLKSDITLTGTGEEESQYIPSLSQGVTTKNLAVPTFTETNEGEVTIKYPESCGSKYTCTYIKDGGSEVTVNANPTVYFGTNGNLIAKITDGTNTITSSTYTVTRDNFYVSSSGNDTTGFGTINKPYSTIAKAYTETVNTSSINVMNNITQTNTANLNENKTITLKSYGDVHSIIRGSSFTNNFLNVTNGTLNLQNITLDGNNVASQGSLIGVSGEGTNLTTNTGTTLKNNNNGFVYQNDFTNLEKLAGAISINNKATVTINNTTITGNTGDYGGGIYQNSEKKLNISGSIINSNTSRHSGGAISANYEIGVSSSTMDSNKGIDGGAVSSGRAITLTNVTLTNNTAAGNGGGVNAYRQSLTINSNSKINNNKAVHGGGVYVTTKTNETTVNTTVENATISGNTSTGNGGGIYSSNSNLTIKNGTTISNNQAAGRGGGIEVSSQSFTMTGGSITGNKITTSGAGHDGGGIMLNGVTTNMSGGSITNNTSLHTGGGLQMYGGTFNLTGGSITGNTGTGLGLYNGATFTVKGGTINSNSGDARGYAANINYGTNDQFVDSKSGYTSNATNKRIASATNNGFSVDVLNGTEANSTNVQLYTNADQSKQKWDVHPYRVENGVVTYVFVSAIGATNPKQCLWVSGNSATAGANVITYRFHGNSGGYWTLENMGSSYYRIKNIQGLCLDLVNGTAANGTNIRAYTCNTANAQKWKFANA